MNGFDGGPVRGISGSLSFRALSDFMNANTMTVLYKGERVAKISWDRTSAAVTEMAKCQRSVNPAGWPSADNPPDPFRR